MKILSIIGILASLALMVSGAVVSQITCYNSNSNSYSYNSIPDDADTWGYCIIAMGVFFLAYSIAGLKKK
jgi:uncharacterized membrane protein YidH (DUF202 family)